ncbi:hypothetical protein [Streptomyces avicenniae]|uniref:hypothetical protein n=1 Tax=Streptomyces avicenniae TaxID=500153 RepID=UPI000A48C3BF|nr:hypothetical protein [Streptomyces avicenniae]
MPKTPFRAHLRSGTERILRALPEESKRDLYVISFDIWRQDQDCRHPFLTVGHNTESQYARVLATTPPDDPAEARWNYAYWILEGFPTLGNTSADPRGRALYLEEVRELGLWDGSEGPMDLSDPRHELLHEHFADVCSDLARGLHADGVLTSALGRPVPVVLFDMDCPGWEVEATEAANPPELIADFLAFQGPG